MESKQKKHWENVYETKTANEISWTQDVPATSLSFIHSFGLPKTANIIDIGGGDSKLVDNLIQEGFENITVLDISATALEKAKLRLGSKAKKVKWIVSDINDFKPTEKYAIWHDRATFHFLTTKPQIVHYLSTARQALKENGFVTIGTFSKDGPKKCSGLHIKQYSENTLEAELENGFKKIRCLTEKHITPFKTTQDFLFCSFKKQEAN